MKCNKRLLSLVLLMGLIFIAYSKIYPFGFSSEDKDTMNLQTYVISDFGDATDKEHNIIWKVRFSRFATPTDFNEIKSPPSPKECNGTYISNKPAGISKSQAESQKWVLGVKASFIKKAYNWIEIIPCNYAAGFSGDTPDSSGIAYNEIKTNATNLQLVGVVKSLDLWVWGGNYNYWLEFYLRDYKGYLHRLSAGDISYVGWRNMRTKVPEYIPQAEHHVPFLKPLELEMIKLWSYPTERVDQFYAYFDYMQVQTDLYCERFNGDELAEVEW